MSSLAIMVFMVAVSAMAIWAKNAVLFMITAGASIMTGLYAPDMLSGDYVTTEMGITIGLMLIAFSFLCCGWALRLMFWVSE